MIYEPLLGRSFQFGVVDCYTMLRDFYKLNYDIDMPDYARPERFWDQGLDLYMDHYEECGFELVHENPRYFRPGDVSLAAIQSSLANHAMIHLGDGRIVHHFIGRLSEVGFYRGIWRNHTVATIRHKDVEQQNELRVDLASLILPLQR